MEHSFYLCFKKRNRGYNSLSVRATERQPSLVAGEAAIRVTVDLPNSLFTRPLLSAKITVPADKVSPATIEANVADNIAQVVRQNLGIEMKISLEDASSPGHTHDL